MIIRKLDEEVVWCSDEKSRSTGRWHGVMTARCILPAYSTGKLIFAVGEPDLDATTIASLDEDGIVSALLYNSTIITRLFTPLVHGLQGFWCAAGLRPRDDLGLDWWQGKPGDLDFLVGPIRSGIPDFSYIIGVEFKTRRAKPDSPGRMSDYGTDQVSGLFRAGCNRAVLVHLVVGHQTPEAALMQGDSGIGTLMGIDLRRACNALLHDVPKRLDPRVGYVLGTWGHPALNSAHARSALWTCPVIRPQPSGREWWLEWQLAHDKLHRSLERLWNRIDPPEHVIRRCPECHHVVPVLHGQDRCGQCSKIWVKPFKTPTAAEVQPISQENL